MKEARTIARYGQIYALANLISRAGGLILLPVYTRSLSLEDYGIYTLLFTIMDLLSLVFGVGIAKAMGRFYFDYPDDGPERRKVVSTTLIGFCMLALIFCALSLPIARTVVAAFGFEARMIDLIAIAACAMAVAVLFEISVGYFVLRKHAWSFFALATAKATLILLTNAVLVIWLERGVAGIVYAHLISFAFLALFASGFCLKRVGFAFDAGLFTQLIKFGLPLVPSAFANSAIRFTERTTIAHFSGVAALASYGLADRLTTLLQMFIATPFSQIFTVRRFESISRDEDQSEFKTVFLLFVAVICCAALALCGFGAEVLRLVAPSGFDDALTLLPILALSHVVSAINLNMELGILYQKRTALIPAIAVISLGLAIGSNWVLVARYGVLGAALSFLLINIARLLMTVAANYRWGTRAITLDWPRACLILSICMTAGIALTAGFGTGIDAQTVVLKAAIVVAICTATLFSPALDKPARAAVLSLWRRRG